VSVAAVAIAAAAFGAVAMLVDQCAMDMSTGATTEAAGVGGVQPGPSTGDPRAGARTAALIERHRCWTSAEGMPEDMRGRVPGHVVVTTASTVAAVYSADLVASALDEVYPPVETPSDADLVVHAFCR
jgi:hypothetical protein